MIADGHWQSFSYICSFALYDDIAGTLVVPSLQQCWATPCLCAHQSHDCMFNAIAIAVNCQPCRHISQYLLPLSRTAIAVCRVVLRCIFPPSGTARDWCHFWLLQGRMFTERVIRWESLHYTFHTSFSMSAYGAMQQCALLPASICIFGACNQSH